MKRKSSLMLVAALLASLAAGAAQARDADVRWSVTIGSPVGAPVYVPSGGQVHGPVYAPVYVPTPRVVVRPVPVYVPMRVV